MMGDKASKTRRERFKTVAPKRLERALVRLEMLRRCANRSQYEFKASEADQVISAIRNELNLLEEAFFPRDTNTEGPLIIFQDEVYDG